MSKTKKVVIIGGGVAGLSAAHELMERRGQNGEPLFEVEVLEAKAIFGGKARSFGVPNSADGGRPELPAEHGFRFFPLFYRHVTDTMNRIPSASGKPGRTVFDDLVEETHFQFAFCDRKPVVVTPRVWTVAGKHSPQDVDPLRDAALIFESLKDHLRQLLQPMAGGLDERDFHHVVRIIWQIFTSCTERREGEYEGQNWWAFITADAYSKAFQSLMAHGLTGSLVACHPKKASAKTVGNILAQFITDYSWRAPFTALARVLNGPTSEIWIDPWVAFLRAGGVALRAEAGVTAIEYGGGKVLGVTVRENGQERSVTGDYFLFAVPVEAMAKLLRANQDSGGDLMNGDPALANLLILEQHVSWMNGILFYLSQPTPIVYGHVIYMDSPWRLTSVSQEQFWPRKLPEYGNGSVGEVLSTIISDWSEPGRFIGLPAWSCLTSQIREEVWTHLKESLKWNNPKPEDNRHHGWFLDPAIEPLPSPKLPGPILYKNLEPLLINVQNSWQLRPEARSRISNLFLAADYVRTFTDMATMEAANEAGRHAVNAILDEANMNSARCEVHPLEEPWIFNLFKLIDATYYKNGQGWPW